MGARDEIAAVEGRAVRDRAAATARWAAATGLPPSERWARQLRGAGRLTINFHPDRLGTDGRSVAAGLLASGAYRSQWMTGTSSGSRSAIEGGERQRFERELFAGAYDRVHPGSGLHPVYGALDLLRDEHGGSPRFGSCFLVLRPHVRDRVTMCVGDSHAAPRDVGTFAEPWAILAGLAEQAAAGDLLQRGLGVDALLAILGGQHGPTRASRALDGYVEIQVHGGVDLADDVDTLVLDPSFRGTDVEDQLARAAQAHGCELAWHRGSTLAADDVPSDFRGSTMPSLARRVAGAGGVVDARAIGLAAAQYPLDPPHLTGDAATSALQQLKYLWHTLVAHGHDAEP